MIVVRHLKILQDNYSWVITNGKNSHCIIIDAGEAQPIIEFVKQKRLTPISVFITHHHSDHIGGISELKKKFPWLEIYGPHNESISGITDPLCDGDVVDFSEIGLGIEVEVIPTPGHTRGHLSYYVPGHLFTGDTLFSAGCGRIFEGTAKQMFDSLNKIKAFPDTTFIYPAHEYTVANLLFAREVEPDSFIIATRLEECQRLREQCRVTLPTMVVLERAINPFFRCDEEAVLKAVSEKYRKNFNSELDVFIALREWKDHIDLC